MKKTLRSTILPCKRQDLKLAQEPVSKRAFECSLKLARPQHASVKNELVSTKKIPKQQTDLINSDNKIIEHHREPNKKKWWSGVPEKSNDDVPSLSYSYSSVLLLLTPKLMLASRVSSLSAIHLFPPFAAALNSSIIQASSSNSYCHCLLFSTMSASRKRPRSEAVDPLTLFKPPAETVYIILMTVEGPHLSPITKILRFYYEKDQQMLCARKEWIGLWRRVMVG